MAARAPINPVALKWARQVGQVSVSDLARALNVKPERIVDFEGGDALPTFRQLTLMAKKLDRALGFFFAPPPSVPDVPATADFRGRPGETLTSDLAKEMRRAEQHRNAMLELADRQVLRLPVGPIRWDNLASQAREFREELGLTQNYVPKSGPNASVFSDWRLLLETHGLLVLQTTGISLTSFRGFSLHHEHLPVIVVNGADSPAGKTFTLFHEVAHLINRTSGLCTLQDRVFEEALANNFAAEFLMPRDEFLTLARDYADVKAFLEELAAHFRVSTLAVAVRLRRFGLIDDASLEEVRMASDDAWERARETTKKKSGFVPQWKLRYRDLGSTFIGVVAGALEDGRVDLVDATYLLNARLPTVEQMLQEYYRTGGAR